jgi:hypothetical protein
LFTVFEFSSTKARLRSLLLHHGEDCLFNPVGHRLEFGSLKHFDLLCGSNGRKGDLVTAAVHGNPAWQSGRDVEILLEKLPDLQGLQTS